MTPASDGGEGPSEADKTKAMSRVGVRPTIVTVAELAGVAISSASRVLNGHSARPDTIERVLQAAEEIGYVPNTAAQALKSSRTGQIAFAVENIANPAYVEMVEAIEAVVAPAGYRIVLHSTNADPDAELDILRDLKRRYVDGLIISPIRVTDAHVKELSDVVAPVVVIGTLPPGVNVDTVSTPSADGVAAAVRHLSNLGRSDIAFVNGPVETGPGSARLRGYRAGLESASLEISDNLIEIGDSFSMQAGANAMATLLSRTRLDAVICANDLLAIGAMRAIRAKSLSIPDDVALVAVDNTYLTEVVHPPLSSVSLHAHHRGTMAAQLLLARIEDPERPIQTVNVDPKLVVRRSSGEPGGAGQWPPL